MEAAIHSDSKEADLYRIALIESWLEEAGLDFEDITVPILTAFIAATNTILDKQTLAMLDPGEDYGEFSGTPV